MGIHSFDFCVTYHPDETKKAFSTIEKFRYPCYVQSMKHAAYSRLAEAGTGAFLNALPRGVQISAFKPAERQDGVVLRLYSIEEQKETIELSMPESVSRVFLATLAEERKEELAVREGKITFEISPRQIITLYMETIS